MSRALLVFITVVGLSAAAHARERISVTECNTVVPRRATAVLQNDLDCGDTVPWGIVLEKGARLELNGFHIVGGHSAGVFCPQRCRIFGPGEIVGSTGDGVDALRVKISGVTIRDAGRRGIAVYKAARLIDVVVVNAGKTGISANRVRGWNVTVVSAGGTGDLVAVSSDRNGITATRAARIDGLIVTGSALGGVDAQRCIVKDGDVSGNQIGQDLPVANPPEYPGGDLRCYNRVKLTDTACGTSLDPDNGETWGVCADD